MNCTCDRDNYDNEPAFNDDGLLIVEFQNFLPNAKAPICMTNGSAGFDLTAAEIENDEDSGCLICHTGIGIALPRGTYGRILCRSSIYRMDLRIIDGTIDSDYRGEIRVVFDKINRDKAIPKYYEVGDRIAQLVICQHERVSKWKLVPQLKPTARGMGGFGSTGK